MSPNAGGGDLAREPQTLGGASPVSAGAAGKAGRAQARCVLENSLSLRLRFFPSALES